MESNKKITMWAAQIPVVLETVQRDGVSYVKQEYIEKKYKEVSWIFRTAYRFFITEFQKRVERPKDAESPVWLYCDPKWAGNLNGVVFMKLEIPEQEMIFFDLRKWSEVLNLQFLGTEQEKKAFETELEQQGIRHPMDVFEKPFYPLLKQKIIKSWKHIFDIENVDKQYLQGAVWCIRKEWIREIVE